MGTNSVKIPIELEMGTISSQINSLKATLKNVKADTNSFKQLNGLVQSLEKSFTALQAESKKTFSSSTEIDHFKKNLEKIAIQAEVFQDHLSQLNITELNIDTSAYEKALKRIRDLQDTIEAEGKIGNVFKDTDVEKLANEMKIKLKPDMTFDDLASAFSSAADKIEERIEGIKNKINSLGQQVPDLSEIEKIFERNKKSSISQRSMQNASNDLYAKFKIGEEGNVSTGISTKEDFIRDQTSKISNALKERRQQLQAEIDKNKQIEAAIEKLNKFNKSSLTNTEKDTVRQIAGISLPKSNNVDEIRKRLEENLQDVSSLKKQRDAIYLDSNKRDAVVQAAVEKAAASIQSTTETAVKSFVDDLRSYLKNQGFKETDVSGSLNKGASETEDAYKDRIRQYVEELIAKRKADLQAEQEALQKAETELKVNQNASTNVQAAASANQQATEQARQQTAEANKEYAAAEEQLKREAAAAIDTAGAVDTLKGSVSQASSAADKGANSLSTLNEATNRLSNIKRIVSYWLGFRSVMRSISSTVKSAVSTIHELDDVMTEISIVTDMSQEDLWGQMDNYASVAQEYGTSIKGVYEVSQLFYQQGDPNVIFS